LLDHYARNVSTAYINSFGEVVVSRQYLQLTTEDEAMLASDREFLPAVIEAHYPGRRLSNTPFDLPNMQEILNGGPYTDSPVGELIALGTVLGDLIADRLDFHWVRYSDEQGVDLALRYGETSIVVFPRGMITKRIEDGEDPDLQKLFDGLVDKVEDLLASREFS